MCRLKRNWCLNRFQKPTSKIYINSLVNRSLKVLKNWFSKMNKLWTLKSKSSVRWSLTPTSKFKERSNHQSKCSKSRASVGSHRPKKELCNQPKYKKGDNLTKMSHSRPQFPLTAIRFNSTACPCSWSKILKSLLKLWNGLTTNTLSSRSPSNLLANFLLEESVFAWMTLHVNKMSHSKSVKMPKSRS